MCNAKKVRKDEYAKIREHYEKNYPFSIKSIEVHKANLRDRLRWYQIALQLTDCDGLLLDVGCGGGAVLRFCKRESVGIDISSKLLRLLNNDFKKEGNFVDFVVADAQYLPFKDKTFDIVVCSETLEHLPQPEIAIREIARTVRLKVLITVPNMFELEAIQASGIKVHNLYNRAYMYLHRNKKSPLDRFYCEHITRGTIPQWRNLLESNGLFCSMVRSICLMPYSQFFDNIIESKVYSSKLVSRLSFILDRLLGAIFPFKFLGQYTLFRCKPTNRD